MATKLINTFLVFLLVTSIVVNSCQHDHHHHRHHHHDHDDHDDHDHHHHHHHDHNSDHRHHGHQQHHDHHDQHQHHDNSHDNSKDIGHKKEQNTKQTHQHPIQNQPLQLKMIQNKPHLLQSLKLTQISVFFYGSSQTIQYQQFQAMQPSYNSQFYEQLTYKINFYHIPSDKFNLTRSNPSLSIYRKINNGEWLFYKGIFERNQMKKWVIKNTIDPLKQLTGQQIDSFFVDSKKGFLLLEFGQFYLLKTKIMLNQFCQKYDLICGKVTHKNKVLNMAIQLLRAQKQPGIPKLGYWNPQSQQLQIYTKDPGQITENQLMQLYSGHQSIIPYQAQIDVGQVIHPQTQFVQLLQPKQNLQL